LLGRTAERADENRFHTGCIPLRAMHVNGSVTTADLFIEASVAEDPADQRIADLFGGPG
jgi:hypothetical protein